MKLTTLTLFAIATLSFCFVSISNAEDTEPKPCLAKDIKTAQNFVPTTTQLKAYVDATVEVYRAAKNDRAIANAMAAVNESHEYSCRLNDNTTILSPSGAQRILSEYPQVAKIYASHNVTARDLGLWAVIAIPLAMSVDPQFGAFAREGLSPQQVAVAKENAVDLRRWLSAVPRTK